MKHLAVIDDSKDFLKKMAYNIIYGGKFKKLNVDKSLSDSLIARRKDSYAKDILKLINKSKNRDEFSTNIIDYLKLKGRNAYANSLLIGNVTEKYNFNSFCYDSVKELNLDAFSKDNKDLLQDLKSHFVEYIVKNNERKNTFSELIKSKGRSEIVMHRRGMDFDTKASYIFATINSSNKEQTAGIMNEIEQIRKKEGLKVVIYDKYKIRESMEKDRQLEDKEEDRER